jgi:carbamate kinase
MIGYWLVQALQNSGLGGAGRPASPAKPVACLVSRTLVSADDPAFGNPAKFVGPVYAETEARQVSAARGWQIRRDGTAWRRVVPSPEPAELLDQSFGRRKPRRSGRG